VTRIVIIGGGPAGYEAALVAAQLGAEVTVVERDGFGGACVLYDCVPSKTFIASSDVVTSFGQAEGLGVEACSPDQVHVIASDVHGRVKGLALAQSNDIAGSLRAAGVELVTGTARLAGGAGTGRRHPVEIRPADGTARTVDADVVLLATGATPRVIAGAEPDGERILSWRQVYDLEALPEHLIVIGSGVTGAEFASAYLAMGVQVTLVSSRDRVMPHEDSDAAELIETVFSRRGMTILKNARASSVKNTGVGVVVNLADGRVVEGSHALMTVGSVPNSAGLGLEEAGVSLDRGGFVETDRVSRTSVSGIYAAGDVTGVLMLASVAAMQGRIAMWHALGEAVAPLKLQTVAANVFTDPEIATVGLGQTTVDAGLVPARTVTLPLATNARAKMAGLTDGFVKLFCRPASGLVIGGVVVAPRASELILPIAMAVENHLTVDQIAHTISIYPSLSGSITEAARQLMQHEFD
jgi:pyruvate/2-oxoglutarate dehydrogenase complex dihydrolipoamide dehydrogenase (E3) component